MNCSCRGNAQLTWNRSCEREASDANRRCAPLPSPQCRKTLATSILPIAHARIAPPDCYPGRLEPQVNHYHHHHHLKQKTPIQEARKQETPRREKRSTLMMAAAAVHATKVAVVRLPHVEPPSPQPAPSPIPRLHLPPTKTTDTDTDTPPFLTPIHIPRCLNNLSHHFHDPTSITTFSWMKQDISFLSLLYLQNDLLQNNEEELPLDPGQEESRISAAESKLLVVIRITRANPAATTAGKDAAILLLITTTYRPNFHIQNKPQKKKQKYYGTGHSSTLSCANCKKQVFVRFANRTRCKSIACAPAATTSKQTTTTTTNPSFSSVAKDNYDQPRPMYKTSDRETKNYIMLLPLDRTTECQLLVPSVGSKHRLSVTWSIAPPIGLKDGLSVTFSVR